MNGWMRKERWWSAARTRFSPSDSTETPSFLHASKHHHSKGISYWAEELAERTGTDRVHGAWLEIDKDGTGHILATGSFVVVHVDALELEVRVTVVGTGGVNAVFIGDDFPELGTDLVTTLALNEEVGLKKKEE